MDTLFLSDRPNSESESDDKVLTMAFVNMQPLDKIYGTEEAFSSGTLFENLNKPFYGGNAPC